MKLSKAYSILVIVLTASSTLAQESSAPPAFFLMIETVLSQEHAADWAQATAMTSQAHAQHPEGNMWATYRRLTGGPGETVRTFFALDQMGDLDSWRSNRQILTEVLGQDRARIVLADLELADSSSESVLSYSNKLSHMVGGFRATKFVWVVEVEVAEGKMTEYAALAQRLVAMAADKGVESWMVYGTAIGGNRSLLRYFYGFDIFAEIDQWTTPLELAAASIGDVEAERLLAAMESIRAKTVSLWQLEPRLSQLEAK